MEDSSLAFGDIGVPCKTGGPCSPRTGSRLRQAVSWPQGLMPSTVTPTSLMWTRMTVRLSSAPWMCSPPAGTRMPRH